MSANTHISPCDRVSLVAAIHGILKTLKTIRLFSTTFEALQKIEASPLPLDAFIHEFAERHDLKILYPFVEDGRLTPFIHFSLKEP